MSNYSKDLTKTYSENRARYTSTDAHLFNEVFKVGLEDKIILDYGCGDGGYSLVFKDKGAQKVVGLDSNPDMIKIAHERLKEYNRDDIEYVVGDGNDLPYCDDSFDVVVANFVIVHFDDLQRPLTEIYRVLKKGGFFIATTNCARLDTVAPVSVRLGGDDNVIMRSFLRSDLSLKKNLAQVGFHTVAYNVVDNTDASVVEGDIQDFHGVLFVVRK